MATYVALLRAIGPATHRVMPLRALCEACVADGLDAAVSHLATGNLILRTGRSAAETAAIVERAIDGFGLANAVVLRSPEALAAVLAACPFPDAATARPAALTAWFLSTPPDPARLAALLARPGPERKAVVAGDLVVDYPDGVRAATLVGSLIERALGVTATARNWNTLAALVARV